MRSPAPAEGATETRRVIVERLADIRALPPPSWRLEFNERGNLYEVIARDDGRLLGTLKPNRWRSRWFAVRHKDGKGRTFDFRPDAGEWIAE